MGIPSPIMCMINATFNPTKKKESHEKVSFCVDCGRESLSRADEAEHDPSHRIFKAYFNTNDYAYLKTDIMSLGSNVLDVSDIRVYNINGKDVYFRKSRNNEKTYAKNMENKGLPNHCNNCGYNLLEKKSASYCSLLCKLGCIEKVKAKLEALVNVVDHNGNGNGNGNSNSNNKNESDHAKSLRPKNSRRKRSRPQRAPFF